MSEHWTYSTPPWDQPEYECYTCGKPMYRDKQYCSNNCFEAAMR